MVDNNTKKLLKELKIEEVAGIVERQESLPDFVSMDFTSRLQFVIQDLYTDKMIERNKRYIKNAGFKYPTADINSIVYTDDRKLDRAVISNLATSNYINHSTNVAFIGATGCGKTFLACVLGIRACTLGFRVKFCRMPDMIADFDCIETPLQKKRMLRLLSNYDLLIIDEWLSQPLTDEQSKYFFEIIEKRDKTHSTIYCSQYDMPEWYERLGNEPAVVESILNRIIHSAVKVNCGNYNMREYYEATQIIY